MSKKMIALFIALMLLCSVATALAAPEKIRIEDFGAFAVEVEIPEGAQYRQNPREGWVSLEIWFEEPSKPRFNIHIAFSDVEGNDGYLTDFDREALDHLMAIAGADFLAPAHEFFVTPAGNTFLLTRETDPLAGAYATMVTVYNGFYFSLYGRHLNFAPLTEDDVRLMHQIIEGVWIIEN